MLFEIDRGFGLGSHIINAFSEEEAFEIWLSNFWEPSWGAEITCWISFVDKHCSNVRFVSAEKYWSAYQLKSKYHNWQLYGF